MISIFVIFIVYRDSSRRYNDRFICMIWI